MTEATLAAVQRLLDADLSEWTGLPELTPGDAVAAFGVDPAQAPVNRDARGEPARPGGWVALGTRRYARGARLWLNAERQVVLVQGVWPRGDDDEPLAAPDLGPAEALLDAELGGLVLRDGERVHASRGLALRVDPVTGDLLEVLAFAPTSVADYRTRLRPALPVDEPLLDGGGR